jgi:hypothetical protein
MGKYGTNLEGFGAFEGGVNADKGAPLVSTSSDGETALLFGPAALREIQAGVANGDFAIPPDAAGDTITAENPLPYWTFTDVNSAGAITAAIVADAGAGSGNVLRFTVASGTLTGKSATLTRYVPVASSASRSFSFYAEATFENGGLSTESNAKITCQFYKADGVTTTGTAFSSATVLFSDLNIAEGLLAPDFYSDPTLLTNSTAPSDAAYLKITITIATVATQPVARTVDLTEVRLGNGLPELLFTDRNNPTNAPGYLICGNAEITLGAPTNQGFLSLGESTTMSASLEMYFDSPSVKIIGENSNWIARVSHTATQSLTNNTSTKAVLSTASSTPSIETYDPNGWFNNANDSIDIGQDGFYCVTANAAFASNATGRREVAIVVNGTTRGSVNVSAASAGTTNLSVTTNLYLVSGDQVTITLVQTSGGALNTANVAGVYPALSVGRIGA